MSPSRRRSLLEDESLVVLGRDEASSGDVCERCGCARGKHTEDGCACGKCDKFEDGSEEECVRRL
jgi:hypothetical protein